MVKNRQNCRILKKPPKKDPGFWLTRKKAPKFRSWILTFFQKAGSPPWFFQILPKFDQIWSKLTRESAENADFYHFWPFFIKFDKKSLFLALWAVCTLATCRFGCIKAKFTSKYLKQGRIGFTTLIFYLLGVLRTGTAENFLILPCILGI